MGVTHGRQAVLISNGVGLESSSAKTQDLPYSIVLWRLRRIWQAGGGGVSYEDDHERQLLRESVVVEVIVATVALIVRTRVGQCGASECVQGESASKDDYMSMTEIEQP